MTWSDRSLKLPKHPGTVDRLKWLDEEDGSMWWVDQRRRYHANGSGDDDDDDDGDDDGKELAMHGRR